MAGAIEWIKIIVIAAAVIFIYLSKKEWISIIAGSYFLSIVLTSTMVYVKNDIVRIILTIIISVYFILVEVKRDEKLKIALKKHVENVAKEYKDFKIIGWFIWSPVKYVFASSVTLFIHVAKSLATGSRLGLIFGIILLLIGTPEWIMELNSGIDINGKNGFASMDAAQYPLFRTGNLTGGIKLIAGIVLLAIYLFTAVYGKTLKAEYEKFGHHIKRNWQLFLARLGIIKGVDIKEQENKAKEILFKFAEKQGILDEIKDNIAKIKFSDTPGEYVKEIIELLHRQKGELFSLQDQVKDIFLDEYVDQELEEKIEALADSLARKRLSEKKVAELVEQFREASIKMKAEELERLIQDGKIYEKLIDQILESEEQNGKH